MFFIPLIVLENIWSHFVTQSSKDNVKTLILRRSQFNVIRLHTITTCCHLQKGTKLDKIQMYLDKDFKRRWEGSEISWTYRKSLMVIKMQKANTELRTLSYTTHYRYYWFKFLVCICMRWVRAGLVDDLINLMIAGGFVETMFEFPMYVCGQLFVGMKADGFHLANLLG
jgi:hypothetical protein